MAAWPAPIFESGCSSIRCGSVFPAGAAPAGHSEPDAVTGDVAVYAAIEDAAVHAAIDDAAVDAAIGDDAVHAAIGDDAALYGAAHALGSALAADMFDFA